ncbi:MAG: 50S ribosome-binding GTPase [Candidatus Heimdallarchaeum endolithica]|uniref:50S ribosome-binding GTPase n=1 Tax=Candidatus Heimdallarchaeum endolithica TaxID=2876572 RepID=A0A9Y1BQQ5_9ARCH|nr:MAG: 50S ribosome-binding GTPase [Candidatus Heimdallarchaeum endolithica]
MLTRELSITILGATGVGKTTLIKRIKGEDIEDISPTTQIEVHSKRIKLKSQQYKSALSLEKYRTYKVMAVDCPGDMSLWPYWKKAMQDYKTNGIIFMIDPTQDTKVQIDALTQVSNYFLMTLDNDIVKAERKARKAKAIFFLVVNKIDLLDFSKAKADEYLRENFKAAWEHLKERYPRSFHGWEAISALKGGEEMYDRIDGIFETIKRELYG